MSYCNCNNSATKFGFSLGTLRITNILGSQMFAIKKSTALKHKNYLDQKWLHILTLLKQNLLYIVFLVPGAYEYI